MSDARIDSERLWYWVQTMALYEIRRRLGIGALGWSFNDWVASMAAREIEHDALEADPDWSSADTDDPGWTHLMASVREEIARHKTTPDPDVLEKHPGHASPAGMGHLDALIAAAAEHVGDDGWMFSYDVMEIVQMTGGEFRSRLASLRHAYVAATEGEATS